MFNVQCSKFNVQSSMFKVSLFALLKYKENLIFHFSLFHFSLYLNLLQRLGEVVEDVVDVLGADAEADGGGSDVLLGQLLGREL